VVAVSIILGGRMGGGIFSPSLMLGALTGLAFGLIASSIFPTVSGEQTIYAQAGMGAVAAAVLGAPISTTLIVFELTGDWQIGLTVMIAVAFSTITSRRLVGGSFFLSQLERRGIHLAKGPQTCILSLLKVSNLMRPVNDFEISQKTFLSLALEEGNYVTTRSTLEDAMPIFEIKNLGFIPVTSDIERENIVGILYFVDALREYNAALVANASEEHS